MVQRFIRAGAAEEPASCSCHNDQRDHARYDELQYRAKGALTLVTPSGDQTPKLSPHEQLLVAFGLRILNPRRRSVSS